MTTRIMEPHEWGMRVARPLIPHKGMPVREVYIHQTAGRDPSIRPIPGAGDPATAFRNSNEYAIIGKDYSAADYTAYVHLGPTGKVTAGICRGEFLPAATRDRNFESKAYCLMGWFGPPDPRKGNEWTYDEARHPTMAELEGLADAIVDGIRKGWIHPDAKILGHRDNPAHPNATACPGDYLYAALPTIRRLVAERLNPAKPDPVAPAPTDSTSPPDPGKVLMEYFNVAPDRLNQSAALFVRVGTLVQYVGVDQWVALGAPLATRVAGRAECRRFHLVNAEATPAPHRGIWANA